MFGARRSVRRVGARRSTRRSVRRGARRSVRRSVRRVGARRSKKRSAKRGKRSKRRGRRSKRGGASPYSKTAGRVYNSLTGQVQARSLAYDAVEQPSYGYYGDIASQQGHNKQRGHRNKESGTYIKSSRYQPDQYGPARAEYKHEKQGRSGPRGLFDPYATTTTKP